MTQRDPDAPERQPMSDTVSGKPALIVSDVHLGAVPDSTERAFREFLAYAAQRASALVIAGDLFDVGYTHEHWVPRRHVRVLASLAAVVESQVPVIVVGGNRDAMEWDAGVLAEDVGAIVYPDPSRLIVAGRQTLIAHGDGARRGASGPYRKPYPVLRHPLFVWAARHLLPTNWFYGFLSRRSPTRRRVALHAQGASTGPKRRAAGIEAWARAAFAADPALSLVVAGHSHLPALVAVEAGRYYVNAGDWISHSTYAVVPADGSPPEIRYWPSRELVDWATLADPGVPVAVTPSGAIAGHGGRRGA